MIGRLLVSYSALLRRLGQESNSFTLDLQICSLSSNPSAWPRSISVAGLLSKFAFQSYVKMRAFGIILGSILWSCSQWTSPEVGSPSFHATHVFGD